jgi:hypothetical protein
LAAAPKLGEIKPGKYDLVAVNHHTPVSFKKVDQFWDSLQKVELQVGGKEKFRDLPALGMKNPYTGYIVLGDQSQKFGVIVDIYGEEKRLYIDSDGDGSSAGEPMTLLLNEWYGIQIYFVTGPEPLELKVKYNSQKEARPIQISVQGLLIQPSVLVKEKPFLLIQVRTWFLACVSEDGYDKNLAIVDRNHNGCYNDPEDQLFIDYDNNMRFSNEEAVLLKKGVRLKSGKSNIILKWGPYPDTLILGGDN